jgi:hypothetical protein
MILSVRTCWFHYMAPLPLWNFSTDFGTRSYQCSLPNLVGRFHPFYRPRRPLGTVEV